MRTIKDKSSQSELEEINPLLQNLLQALANNIYFTRMLLLARALLFGQSETNGQKILKSYTKSNFFVLSILNPSELLKESIEIKNDLPLIKGFRILEGRNYRQAHIEKHYKDLPHEKQLKLRDIFAESICLSIINELSKIKDIDIVKLLFVSTLKENVSENGRKFIHYLEKFKTEIITIFIKDEKLKDKMLVASDKRWNELEIIWRTEAHKFGFPGFVEPRFILGFVVLCVVMAIIIKEMKIYQNPVALSFFLLFGFTLPIHLVADPRDVRVDLFCGSSVTKALSEELACKGIFLNEKLMPLLEVAEEEVEPKKTIFVYKLADQPPKLSTSQASESQSTTNFFTSFFQRRLPSKSGDLQQFYVEDKKESNHKEKIYQALIKKGYLLDDEKNVFSPKLVEYHHRLVIFSFYKGSLEKIMAGLDEKICQILEKAIQNPNPQRFDSTSEQLNGQPILIKGRLDGKHLRIVATHKKIINLGSELGDIEEFCFTAVINKHEQTQFFNKSTKFNSKNQTCSGSDFSFR